MKKELSEKERVFLKTLQDLSELWEARAEDWTKRDGELEEMLQKMVKQKVEELQVRWFLCICEHIECIVVSLVL